MAEDPLSPGDIYICQHPARRVVKARLAHMQPGTRFCENEFEVVSDGCAGKPLNSPNDLVVAKDGAVWFTDPIYGLLQKNRFSDEWRDNRSYLEECAAAGAGCKGVYRAHRDISDSKWVTQLMTKFHRRPNGLAFSPDGAKLYVADSTIGQPTWTAYPVTPDQTLGKALAVINSATLGCELGVDPSKSEMLLGHEGVSDGFKVDENGLIWSSMPNGLVVFDPERMEVILQILLGCNTSNVCFGAHGDVFLTGAGHLWRLKRRIRGSPTQLKSLKRELKQAMQHPELRRPLYHTPTPEEVFQQFQQAPFERHYQPYYPREEVRPKGPSWPIMGPYGQAHVGP